MTSIQSPGAGASTKRGNLTESSTTGAAPTVTPESASTHHGVGGEGAGPGRDGMGASEAFDGGSLTHIENATAARRPLEVKADPHLSKAISLSMLGAGTLPRPEQLARPGARSESHGYRYGGDKADLGTRHKYDSTVMNGGKLNPPLGAADRKADKLAATHERLDKALAAAYPGGVEFKPAFQDPKSAEAADAKHALLEAFNNERGGHQDRVVDLNGTRHCLSADISKAGKATVTLHGPGTAEIPASSTFKTVAEATAALQKDFGVSVASAPKAFALDELNKAHAAFSLTQGAERAALQGVVLERHTSLGGSRVAEFSGSVEVGPPPAYKKAIRVGDATFTGDSNSFVGSGAAGSRLPPSVQVLVHETGHAVEAEKLNSALNARNLAVQPYDTHTTGDFKAAADAYYNLTDSKSAHAVPLKPPALRVNAAIVDVDRKTQALASAKTDRALKTAKAALDAAIRTRDTAMAKLPADDPTAATAKAMVAAQNTRAALALPVATATTASEAAGTLTKDAAGNYQGPSTRLQDFSAYVTKHKIPAFTDYATKEGAQEFYAEAYALYRTDPQWMKANSPKLFEYFEKNKHLG